MSVVTAGDRVIYEGREGVIQLELGGSIADHSDAESDATSSDRIVYSTINFDDGTEITLEDDIDSIQLATAAAAPVVVDTNSFVDPPPIPGREGYYDMTHVATGPVVAEPPIAAAEPPARNIYRVDLRRGYSRYGNSCAAANVRATSPDSARARAIELVRDDAINWWDLDRDDSSDGGETNYDDDIECDNVLQVAEQFALADGSTQRSQATSTVSAPTDPIDLPYSTAACW